MSQSVWTQLKYFLISEEWGDPWKMNGALLLTMDLIRHYVGYKFVVHCGHAYNGHSEDSQHYVGNAIDGHFEGISLEEAYVRVCETLILLQIEDRVGLGLYPEWNNRGLHLDLKGSGRRRWCYRGGIQRPIEEAFNEYEATI